MGTPNPARLQVRSQLEAARLENAQLKANCQTSENLLETRDHILGILQAGVSQARGWSRACACVGAAAEQFMQEIHPACSWFSAQPASKQREQLAELGLNYGQAIMVESGTHKAELMDNPWLDEWCVGSGRGRVCGRIMWFWECLGLDRCR